MSVYIFDTANGKMVHRIEGLPDVVLDLDFSPDGKYLAAGIGVSNGTIGWYRTTDGKPLVSLFPGTDAERWIAWTPKGFYACSENNADDYIGWHLNQGIDSEALFFPASNFTSRMNRPDIVTSVTKNCETDEEFLTRNGINVDDISTQFREMISLSQMKEERAVSGKPIRRIYSVDPAKGMIIVASAKTGELVNIKDTLRVIVDGKKMAFEATFPMMTSIRCQAKKSLSAQDLGKIVKGDAGIQVKHHGLTPVASCPYYKLRLSASRSIESRRLRILPSTDSHLWYHEGME